MAKHTQKTSAVEDRPIPLQDPERWTVRIADNTEDDQERIEELIADGWQYVDAEDLAVNSKDIGFKVMDSHVVRGDHGEDVLIKILTVDLEAFEAMDKARTPTPEAVKAELRDATRAPEPSQVADRVYPATRYGKGGKTTVVANAEADRKLGPGWSDSPKTVRGAKAAKAATTAKTATARRARAKANAKTAAHAQQ